MRVSGCHALDELEFAVSDLNDNGVFRGVALGIDSDVAGDGGKIFGGREGVADLGAVG